MQHSRPKAIKNLLNMVPGNNAKLLRKVSVKQRREVDCQHNLLLNYKIKEQNKNK
jgi:hypothetical protein